MASPTTNVMSMEHSELLCFVIDKSKLMAFDHIVKIVTDFYSEDDLLTARSLLDSYVDRLPKRRGPDMIKSTAEDIVKAVLNPSFNLPVFYARDLSRLPPVDVSHCDVSAILMELRALRNEVRNVSQMKGEIELLKSEVAVLKSTLAELHSVPTVPPTAVVTNSAAVPEHDVPRTMSAAQRLETAIKSGDMERNIKKTVKKLTVVGKSTNTKMQAVTTYRNVDLFISRVHPSLADSIIKECVQDALISSPTTSSSAEDRYKDVTIISYHIISPTFAKAPLTQCSTAPYNNT